MLPVPGTAHQVRHDDGHFQVVGRPNSEARRYGDILLRLCLLPNVDPVVAIVMLTNFYSVQPRRLSDLRQYLGLNLFRVVWLRFVPL